MFFDLIHPKNLCRILFFVYARWVANLGSVFQWLFHYDMSFSVKMKWTGEQIAAFLLTLYLRECSGFGKTAARYLDLIHFPQPVRPICHSPDIGNAEGGREIERQRGRDMWKGGEERLGYSFSLLGMFKTQVTVQKDLSSV